MLTIKRTNSSLIILGPPKTGTSTFSTLLNNQYDVIWKGKEHHAFDRCHFILSGESWNNWLNDYEENTLKLYNLNNYITSNCKHVLEKFKDNQKTCNEHKDLICLEKGPSYSRSPPAAILLVTQIVNIKLLTIIRHPYDNHLSYCWHFARKKKI